MDADNNQTQSIPNIIIIYTDDLGYRDVGAYGATELNTPNIDNLAIGGLRFTNGYSTSATCTPSRYGLRTGTYPWRKGDWIMIPPYKGPSVNEKVNIELGNSNDYQLYNLIEDFGQKKNLADVEKEKLKEKLITFERIRGNEYTNIQKLELR